MSDRPDLVRTPQTGAPDRATERRRRIQAGWASAAGLVIGAVIGAIAGLVFAPASRGVQIGLVVGLAIIGVVAGGLLAEARTAGDMDAPVRDRTASGPRHAATDPRGQLPGSPVRPQPAPARDTTSRLPSQQDLDDPGAGKSVPGSEWGRPDDTH